MSPSRTKKENQENKITGSSAQDEPVYLTIGHLGKPHGVKGEIILYLLTDFPRRIRKGKKVFVGEDFAPRQIEQARVHNRGMLLKFEGIDSVDEVRLLSKAYVYVKTDSLPPLPEGEYYHHQLLGMRVFTEDEQEVGTLTQILETGANDVYLIITPDGKEELVPALKENLVKVDVEHKIMVVKLLDYYNQD